MGFGNKFIKPKLIEIYDVILKNGIIPCSATWPVILAILTGPPNWEGSPDPVIIFPS